MKYGIRFSGGAGGHNLLYCCEVLCLVGALLALTPIVYAAGRIAATVGDAEITEAELSDAVGRYLPRGSMHQTPDLSKQEEYRRKALDDLADFERLYREAIARGVRVSKEQIDALRSDIVKRFRSEEGFKKALREKGFSDALFEKRLEKTVAVNELLEQLRRESVPSAEEVKTHYEKHRERYVRQEAVEIRHMLLSVETTATAETIKERGALAERLLARLREGEDFGSLASQYSDDPYRFKGGDLGFVERGRMTPQELDDAAFSLKPGEISPVVRTTHGFHILKAGEKRAAGQIPFDEAREGISRDLGKKRFDGRKAEILDRMRKTYPLRLVDVQGAGRSGEAEVR